MCWDFGRLQDLISISNLKRRGSCLHLHLCMCSLGLPPPAAWRAAARSAIINTPMDLYADKIGLQVVTASDSFVCKAYHFLYRGVQSKMKLYSVSARGLLCLFFLFCILRPLKLLYRASIAYVSSNSSGRASLFAFIVS